MAQVPAEPVRSLLDEIDAPLLLQQQARELEKVVQPLDQNAPNDIEIQFLIVVHGDVAEPDHLAQSGGQRRVQASSPFQQVKRFTRLLRDAETMDPHQVARSMAAALFSSTSSAIHRALRGDALQDTASFFVQPGVGAENAVFEQTARLRRGIVEQAAGRQHLHGHDRRGRAQVD